MSHGSSRINSLQVLGSAIRSKAPAKYHDKLIPKYRASTQDLYSARDILMFIKPLGADDCYWTLDT